MYVTIIWQFTEPNKKLYDEIKRLLSTDWYVHTKTNNFKRFNLLLQNLIIWKRVRKSNVIFCFSSNQIISQAITAAILRYYQYVLFSCAHIFFQNIQIYKFEQNQIFFLIFYKFRVFIVQYTLCCFNTAFTNVNPSALF